MAELTEAVAEVAEEVADKSLLVAGVSRSLSGRDFGLGFVSGGVLTGTIVSWRCRKFFETKYDKIAAEEIAEMREHYRAKKVKDALNAPTVVVPDDKPKLEEIIEERGYAPPPPGDPNVAPTRMQPQGFGSEAEQIAATERFERQVDIEKTVGEWNYEFEVSRRTPDAPYIIHEDEFADKEYTSVTLTYYEEDKVLADEFNKPVDDKERLVGSDNLSRFGHGSNNPNVVHIRNDTLGIDAEVIKVEGSFGNTLLGPTALNDET
jgi:hypothetical protein